MTSSLLAQQWDGSDSTDWTDADNWSGSSLPTTSTNVTIDTTAPNAAVLGVVGADTGVARQVTVGQDSTGTLTIQNGSTLTSDGSTMFLGRNAGGDGTLTVTGAGSLLSTAVSMTVGQDGDGHLFILNEGTVSTGVESHIGRAVGSSGDVTVNDGDWTVSGNLYVGQGGTGTLSVSNGGTVAVNVYSIGGSIGGGALFSGAGVVDVQGAGSQLTATNEMLVGAGGDGQLTIGTGALVSDTFAIIAHTAGSTGEVTVDNATWNNSGVLTVGRGGTGTLTITNGGNVTASDVIVSRVTGGDGTLRIEGTPGMRGTLETGSVSRRNGTTASMVFDGGMLRATADNAAFVSGFNTSELTIDAGGALVDDGGFAIGIESAMSGVGALTTSGGGTITLTGTNTYSGGTTITTGTLQLGNGGTSGSIIGDVANAGILAFNRSNTMDFGGVISGAGTIRQIGSGLTNLTGDSSGFTGTTAVEAGTLAVNGNLCGPLSVLNGGTLQGTGTVCDVDNLTGGTIAPGNSIGTLTIAGDYTGSGGLLEFETVLGGDASATDQLVITGNTSGTSNVRVFNQGGGGAQTVEGIKIIDVGGTSAGTFSLLGDYVFEGDQAVVGGAYAYRLYQHGIATPADGDWYLRSSLIAGAPDPGDLYAPGLPLYESYADVLQGLNEIDTLRRRTGDRTHESPADGPMSWAGGMWSRAVATDARFAPQVSTTGTGFTVGVRGLEAGIDSALYADTNGVLVGGLSARYGSANAAISSRFGQGVINIAGYGLGGTLTWYEQNGFYADAQAEATLYEGGLFSTTLGVPLVTGNNGFGYAFSLEAGQQIALDDQWTLTPQAQIVYSATGYDGFTDPYGAIVSPGDSSSLTGRLGLSIDYAAEWGGHTGQAHRATLYGVTNLYYDFLQGSTAGVSGVTLVNGGNALAGGVGIGGALEWQEGTYRLHGEALARTELENPLGNYALSGTLGFRMRW